MSRTDLIDLVPGALGGDRLDRLVALMTGMSRSQCVSLIADGHVKIGGKVITKPALRLIGGQSVVVSIDSSVSETPSAIPRVPFDVVYSDESVLVINKPAGLVVHPGNGQASGTLSQALAHQYPDMAEVGDPERPGIVHRLDKSTTGLMVVARTQEAFDELVAQLGDRTVHREYSALVAGHTAPGGSIDAPIGRSQREPTKMSLSPRGREAITNYELVHHYSVPEKLSLVTCRLETGRTHQIRVHMSAIGHAVVGDDRYAGVRRDVPVTRPMLHARSLGFVHPVTGDDMSFSCELPDDFLAVLATLS